MAFLPAPQWPIYCAANAGIHSYTISLRAQLKRTNVRVFELAPPLTMTPLATGAADAEDLKGIPMMPAEKLARRAIEGMGRDKLEIRPGLSNVMKLIGRIPPNWLLQRMIDPTVARMVATIDGRHSPQVAAAALAFAGAFAWSSGGWHGVCALALFLIAAGALILMLGVWAQGGDPHSHGA